MAITILNPGRHPFAGIRFEQLIGQNPTMSELGFPYGPIRGSMRPPPLLHLPPGRGLVVSLAAGATQPSHGGKQTSVPFGADLGVAWQVVQIKPSVLSPTLSRMGAVMPEAN